jgi:Rab proteins geranylgeranyltransferase component A
LEGENPENPAKLLWSLRYTQHESSPPTESSPGRILLCPPPSVDLAFDDSLIGNVREMWRSVMGEEAVEEEFMRFEDREDVGGRDGEGSDTE